MSRGRALTRLVVPSVVILIKHIDHAQLKDYCGYAEKNYCQVAVEESLDLVPPHLIELLLNEELATVLLILEQKAKIAAIGDAKDA